MTEAVRYRVSMSRPDSHLYEVEAEFPSTQGPLTVALPVWTPGSYMVREFSRHLQDLWASTIEGKRLKITRLDKRAFEVDSPGQRVCLRYRVYANELTVRTSHLDRSHGYFNGATLFLYSEPLRELPHRVTLYLPRTWKAFSALDRDGDEWVAPNYDELLDSPFELGPHQPLEFTSGGATHQIVVWGQLPVDSKRMVSDIQRLCEVEAKLFGELPVRRFLFLLYLVDKGRGGLEHQASTSLVFPRAQMNSGRGWEDFLSLVAHEYFHLWSVKRIKPKQLVPIDYSKENYTSLLWLFEGGTAYYESLMLRRAGLMSANRFLTRLGETITALHGTPGRKIQTLADASLTAWIKHYRADENTLNSAISYYLKGEVVAALLDLEIRRVTQDRKSLDDLMRLLWGRYGDGSGVPEDGVEAAANEVAGKDLWEFFRQAIRSTHELEYYQFSHVGLEVKFRVRESPNDKGGTPPRLKPGELKARCWLGISLKGASTIASVHSESPAAEAGLYVDDEILAMDGYRVDGATLTARCEEKRHGEVVKLTIFRRDQLMEVSVSMSVKPMDAAYMVRVEKPTDAQKMAYKAWVGAEWEEPEPPPASNRRS